MISLTLKLVQCFIDIKLYHTRFISSILCSGMLCLIAFCFFTFPADMSHFKFIGLNFIAKLFLYGFSHIFEPYVCKLSASAADNMIMSGRIIVSIRASRLSYSYDLAFLQKRFQIIIYSCLNNFRIIILHFHKNMFRCGMFSGIKNDL